MGSSVSATILELNVSHVENLKTSCVTKQVWEISSEQDVLQLSDESDIY